MMKQRSKAQYLYVHVPFCASICSYCDFAHQIYNANTVDLWLKAIETELQETVENHLLKTIYIGGGTPTSLDKDQLDQLLSLLDPYTNDIEEYTIEINPETLDEEKAEVISKHNVNRASIGLQTSDEALLKKLGRRHTFDDCKKTIDILKRHGICNLSIDLMYSLPGQTMANLKQSLKDALSLEPTHLSLYSLTIEENTVFGKKGYDHLDEDIEADMYEYISKELPMHGFHQYEISNFALNGFESQHNKAYWHYEDFIGIGCGASGKEGLIRYDHERSVQKYISDPFHRIEIHNTKEDAMFEMVMMGLRLKEGLKEQHFFDTWNVDIHDIYAKPIAKLVQEKLLYEEDGFLKTTDRGFEILNTVLEEFF